MSDVTCGMLYNFRSKRVPLCSKLHSEHFAHTFVKNFDENIFFENFGKFCINFALCVL